MTRVFLSLAIALLACQVQAREVTGPAKVVDSTGIEIDGQQIVLFGTNSVMRKQVCTVDGKVWQCWDAAVRGLQILVDQGPVTCQLIGEPDPYGRMLGRCSVNGKSSTKSWCAVDTRSHGQARRPTTWPPKRKPRTRRSASGRDSSADRASSEGPPASLWTALEADWRAV